MRTAGVVSLILGLLLLVTRASSASILLGMPDSVGLVPGSALTAGSATSVDSGVAQLVTFADARVAWLRLGLPLASRWRLQVTGAQLRAGAWREEQQSVRLVARGRYLAAVVGASRVRGQLEDWVDLRHGRGWLEVAYRWGPARLGARWEGPWRPNAELPVASLLLHAVISGPDWSVGAWRPRARYSQTTPWGVGFLARLHAVARVGLRLQADRADVQLALTREPFWVTVVLPIGSLVAAGPTVAVGWAP